MNYLNLIFYAFFPVVFLVYYIVPGRYRYIVICIASWVFYGYADPKLLAVLALISLISWLGGWIIPKSRYKRSVYALFFLLEIAILGVFKYAGFVIDNLNRLLLKAGASFQFQPHLSLMLPVGLSFLIFQTCTYLSDVYRRKMEPEKNLVRYCAFAAFFPTILSGPIQKARNLIPQLAHPAKFDYEQAQKGILLFVWGLFEKVMVASHLQLISSTVMANYWYRSSAELLIAAVSFSLYIYADFSSYSDMARGIGKLLGIDVGRNFQNPYLSTSTSEFWTRWHVSLNDWFVENVYIPLGGNRKGTVRKYRNMLLVFAISGLWHGASWHFVAWGIANGILAVLGQILSRPRKRFYEKTGINEHAESVVLIKRAIVFLFITFTWVLFTMGTMDSLRIWKRILLFDVVHALEVHDNRVVFQQVVGYLFDLSVVFGRRIDFHG